METKQNFIANSKDTGESSKDKEVTGVAKLLTGSVYIPQVALVELDLLTLATRPPSGETEV